ncbi:MAG: EAL domain-containing protein [Massilia sp.]
MGKTLRLGVLAEGIETIEQLAFFTDAGCAEYQGYLYSRPLPADALERFIADTTITS